MNSLGTTAGDRRVRLAIQRVIVGMVLFCVGTRFIPQWWCARQAGQFYLGDISAQGKLARGVERWINSDLKQKDFTSGFSQINGEWLFGSYMMAGMGFGQVALEHPEWRETNIVLIGKCIDKLLSNETRKFDKQSWGSDPIDSLDTADEHGSYLGYLNLLLSMERRLNPSSKYAKLNDQITETLARRIQASPQLLLQSYPGQVFPVDNCAVLGSIGLYDRAVGSNHGELITRWVRNCRTKYIHPGSGLLYQTVDYSTGRPLDAPRGSGSCFGIYFLSFADRSFAQEMYNSVKAQLADSLIGFGVVREYPASFHGHGSVDSGPIIFGYGMSPTAFSIGCSRIFRDQEFFSRLFATAYLFGAPVTRDGRENFVMGGPIGDAMIFALLTAQPEITTVGKPHK